VIRSSAPSAPTPDAPPGPEAKKTHWHDPVVLDLNLGVLSPKKGDFRIGGDAMLGPVEQGRQGGDDTRRMGSRGVVGDRTA
jgi:hypothetical protein